VSDVLRENLLDAAFEGVTFAVEAEQGELGHDIVEHTAYGRDGASLEAAGWRARRGTLTAVFLNGVEGADQFPGNYNALVRAVREHPIGSFAHPVEGLMDAAFTKLRRETSGAERGGTRVEIEWVEHNASAASLATFAGSPATDGPANAAQRAADADAAMAAADPAATYTPLAPVVATQLEFLEAAPRTYAEIDAALRTVRDVVEADAALPALATVAGYAAVAALAGVRAAGVARRARYLPDHALIREYLVTTTMADFEVAAEVYGDAKYAPLVRQANALPDFLAIPPGTRLVILPNR
jgi:prophage DNA circulation protein